MGPVNIKLGSCVDELLTSGKLYSAHTFRPRARSIKGHVLEKCYKVSIRISGCLVLIIEIVIIMSRVQEVLRAK